MGRIRVALVLAVGALALVATLAVADSDEPQAALGQQGAALNQRGLQQQEIESLLSEQGLVRVGFAAGEERYLIPLGYVWFEGALCGFTSRGRKTRMAQADPRISFQVDTSATTGYYTWLSVTGQGNFEVIEEGDYHEKLGRVMGQKFPDMPQWLKEYRAAQQAAGELVAWRIQPSSMTGVKLSPPDR